MPEHSTIAAVRGAIQVAENRAELVQAATARLLTELLDRNGFEPRQIVSAIFTATPDLDSDFPAHAARRLGWTDVPLLGAMEMAVPGALPRVVRVLLTVSGVEGGRRLTPVYLEGAARLRPDLAGDDAPRRASDQADGEARGGGDETPPRAIAIVGLGQIGGSIGLALGAAGGWRRTGFDSDPEVRARAVEAGAIDRAAESIEAACVGADLVVIATPVDTIPDCVAAAAGALPKGAALVDTGSARRGITPALRAARERGIDAIGGHPLAGNEGHGLDSAKPDLFRGARFVLCPVAPDAPTPATVAALVADLGAEARIVEADAHDAALARTSHLPYLLARALHAGGADAERAGLSGPAFRDMTRISRSDPRIAEPYCRENLGEIRAAWTRFREDVEGQLRKLANIGS